MIKNGFSGLLLSFPLAAGMFFPGLSCDGAKTRKASNMNQNQNSNSPVAQKKLNGSWGGQGISMDVTDNGASLDFDCASGRITEAIVPDRAGKFTAKGLFARQRPGPTREGDDNDGQPATYTGVINGDNLTLTINLTRTMKRWEPLRSDTARPARNPEDAA
jgi:hypothetical protein